MESLPDGGYIVEISGVQYRAVTIAELRRISQDREELKRAIEGRGLLERRVEIQTQLVTTLKERITTIERERDLERANAATWKDLFDAEQALRKEAQKLVGKRPSALTRFLNHPATRVVIQAVPLVLARVKF